MGKYALLLQQLMKAVTSTQGPSLQEIAEDIEELQKAEEMVRFQLRHGNDLLAMDSLRDCDVSYFIETVCKTLFKMHCNIIKIMMNKIGECERARKIITTKRVPCVARARR